MKKKFTSFMLLYFFALLIAHAQPSGSSYGRVLYRVNAGGSELNSQDTSNVKWSSDHPTQPSPYIDTSVVGNKTLTVIDTILFDPSVPPNTPVHAMKSERSISFLKPATELDWNFAIPAGTEIEVRLYFAEIYYNAADARRFDVKIEGLTVITNYDIFAEVGFEVAVMKNFIVTSDGNLDIDLIKIKDQPKINAIEIIELTPGSIAGVFNRKNKTSISAYPNPFKDGLSVDINLSEISDMTVYDIYGKQLENVNMNSVNKSTNIDLSQHPIGTYFLKVSSDNKAETIRIVKQ